MDNLVSIVLSENDRATFNRYLLSSSPPFPSYRSRIFESFSRSKVPDRIGGNETEKAEAEGRRIGGRYAADKMRDRADAHAEK